MELDAKNLAVQLEESVNRLSAAATFLEKTVSWLEERESARSGDVQRVVATAEATAREAELERRLAEAERTITALQAQGGRTQEEQAESRRTLPSATVQLLAKQGIGANEPIEMSTLDAALAGLSLEQRIAVKSQLLRTGALS